MPTCPLKVYVNIKYKGYDVVGWKLAQRGWGEEKDNEQTRENVLRDSCKPKKKNW